MIYIYSSSYCSCDQYEFDQALQIFDIIWSFGAKYVEDIGLLFRLYHTMRCVTCRVSCHATGHVMTVIKRCQLLSAVGTPTR